MGIRYIHKCKVSHKYHNANHLCQIIIDRDLGKIRRLVKDARFYCKNCGRAAHNAENLCNPSRI